MAERRGGDWETILVFVSSTFADMQAERDALRVVFDQLSEWLLPKRRFLVAIDLRWGVDTLSRNEEVEKELHVLKVCLEEIRRSRPFFIGILGDRYGWIPDEHRMRRAVEDADVDLEIAGKSITALEIEYGVFARPEQQRRSLFFLRESLPYDDMPASKARRFSDSYATDPGAPARARALDQLRRAIEQRLSDRVEAYELGWDREAAELTGLDRFAECVHSRLKVDIERRLREDSSEEIVEDDPWADDRLELEQFFEERLRTLVGRDAIVEDLEQRATLPEPEDRDASWRWWIPQRGVRGHPAGFVLVGEAGSGKSAVLAALWRRLEAQDSALVLSHSAGAGPRSASVELLLRRWTDELSAVLGQDSEMGDRSDLVRLRRLFELRLSAVAKDRLVVLLVDALDQFQATPDAEHLTFLPEPLPPNVRLAVSGQPGEITDRLAARPDVEAVPLAPLSRDQLADLLRRVAAAHRRELHGDIVVSLLDSRLEPTPLWARLAIDALLLLDEDDFGHAEDFEGSADQQLHGLLCHTAGGFPSGAPAMYERQYLAAEERFGETASATLRLIATTQGGLRDPDLRALVPLVTGTEWDELRVAEFRRSLRGVFTRRGDGRLDFLHAQGRRAAQWRCRRAETRELHLAIADHLESLLDDDPLRREGLLFHLLAAGASDRIADAFLASAGESGSVRVIVTEMSRAPDEVVGHLVGGLAGRRPVADRLEFGRILVECLLPAARVRTDLRALEELATSVQITALTASSEMPEEAWKLLDQAELEEARLALEAGADRALVEDLARGVALRGEEDTLAGRLTADEALFSMVEAWRLMGLAAEQDDDVDGAFDAYRRAEGQAARAAAAHPISEDLVALYCQIELDVARAGMESLDRRRAECARAALDRAADLVDSLGGDRRRPMLQGSVVALWSERARRRGDALEALWSGKNALSLHEEATRLDPGSAECARRAAETALQYAWLATEAAVSYAKRALASAIRHRRDLPPAEVNRSSRDLDFVILLRRIELGVVFDDDEDLIPALADCLARVGPPDRSGLSTSTGLPPGYPPGQAGDPAEASSDGPETDPWLALAQPGSPDGTSRSRAELEAAVAAEQTVADRVLDGLGQVDRSMRSAGGLMLKGPLVVVLAAGFSVFIGVMISAGAAALPSLLDWMEARGGEDAPTWLLGLLDGLAGVARVLAPAVGVAVAAATLVWFAETTRGSLRSARWSGMYTGRDQLRLVRFAAGAATFGAGLLAGLGLGAGVGVAAAERFVSERWDGYTPVVTRSGFAAVVAATVAVLIGQATVARARIRELRSAGPVTAALAGFESSLADVDFNDVDFTSHQTMADECWELFLSHRAAAMLGPAASNRPRRSLTLGLARERAGYAGSSARAGRPRDALVALAEAEAALTDMEGSTAQGDDDLDVLTVRCRVEMIRASVLSSSSLGADVTRAELARLGLGDDPFRHARGARRAVVECGLTSRSARSAVTGSLLAEARGKVRQDPRALAEDAQAVSARTPDIRADVAAQLDAAAADLVRGSAMGALDLSAPSVSAAVGGQRRLRRLRRQGVLIPPAVAEARSVGWGGAYGTPSRMSLRRLRASWENVRASVGTLWGYRVELLPVAVGLVLMLVAAVAGAANVGIREAVGDDPWMLVPAVVPVAATAGFFGLCWLSPARRQRARHDRDCAHGRSPTISLRRVVIAEFGDETPVAETLARVAGGTVEDWRGRLATIVVAPVRVRSLDRESARALAEALRDVGAHASVEPDTRPGR